MAAAIGLRADYAGDRLRRPARESSDANQTGRLLALASIYDGGSRSHAAKLGGVGLQVIRDWVLRFNANGSGGVDRPQGDGCGAEAFGPPAPPRPERAGRAPMSSMQRLRDEFDIDFRQCPRCGAALRVLAVIMGEDLELTSSTTSN